MKWLFTTLLAVGCANQKDGEVDVGDCTIDAGYSTPSVDALLALNKANCYRSSMALSLGKLDRSLDSASQSHAEYMAGQGVMSHQEDIGRPGFSGEWVWDRIVEFGYESGSGTMISEVVAFGHEPAGAVDSWMNSVYHRMPFTLPSWVDAGFGQSETFSSMTFVSPWPNRIRQAVVYPVDGQVDVNPAFDSDSEMPDPAPSYGEVGTPITVTVSDLEADGPDSNPFRLELIEAELIGPAGQSVEVLLADPTQDDNLFQMAVMLPVASLEPNSDYIARMTVEWNGGRETLESTFRTGI